jgi:uncharacterized protein (TIGR02246 family)
MNDSIKKPIVDFSSAWDEKSGGMMALCFTDDAHFVAYDGTNLIGGKAIGDWHQPALNTVLRGTTLKQEIHSIQMLTPDLALAFGSGGPVDEQASAKSKLLGDSHVTFLVKRVTSDDWKISLLQVTRKRRVTGQNSAMIWQAFNLAWVGDTLN